VTKIVGTEKRMLVLVGTVPAGVPPETFRAMIGNSVSISTALMAQVSQLAIAADTAVVEDVVGRLGKPLNLT